MELIHHCCCGIDVHKRNVVANLLRRGVTGAPDLDEVRSFGTMTGELLELSDWLVRKPPVTRLTSGPQ